MMEVRAKKALGQHFLTDQKVARKIVDALVTPFPALSWSGAKASSDARPVPCLSQKDGKGLKAAGGSGESYSPVLEVGPGMGVLTQYLLERKDINLKLVEIDTESVNYLLTHFPDMEGRLMEADFLKLRLEKFFPADFAIIGNFPYNISSQIFFKVLDYREQIPEVVGMVQKEVAERLAEGPGSKTYGILSVLLQAWYDIEYLFTVGSGCFAPPPKVESAVIRLTRNGRTSLGCDEALFKTVVKTAFGQRRKMMRNPLKPLVHTKAVRLGWNEAETADFLALPVFSQRPEQLSVEDFVALTNLLA
ncbi:MAG: 16S rRNA (adenine(1518)-N(6)/adenine(1519)-N(6))-dimethyltransferase RsmA [Bacteroidales bacterium]|nr:16S rRNA (adenine(1518)-N(6)/adenine(1519)-N(6))-dimethyltransferase RsmA [Bacteroidales bacterium]